MRIEIHQEWCLKDEDEGKPLLSINIDFCSCIRESWAELFNKQVYEAIFARSHFRGKSKSTQRVLIGLYYAYEY